MNELETIVLQKLQEMEVERRQEMQMVNAEIQSLRQQIQSLKADQDESGQQLLRLSELYASLQPLVRQFSNILATGIK